MKIHTLQEWQNGEHGGFSEYCLPYSQVDEDIYWYFMEILPPKYNSHGFQVSEPYSYCEQYNTATYATFVKYGGSHYYLGNISPKAVNDEFVKLMELLK